MLRRYKRVVSWTIGLAVLAAWVWLSSHRTPLGLRIEKVGVRTEGTFRSLSTLSLNSEGVSFEYDWSATSDPNQALIYGVWEHQAISSIRDNHWYWRSRNMLLPVFDFERFDRRRWVPVTTGFRYPSKEVRIGLPWLTILLVIAMPIGFKRLLRHINEPHGSFGLDACEACGYSMLNLTACPECNWQRPDTDASN